MSLQVFQYSLQEIDINLTLVAQLMGYPENAIPNEINDIIYSEIKRFPASDEIQGGYTIKPCHLNHDKYELRIEDQTFNLGKKLLHFYKNAENIAIFACTAGGYISNRSKELMAQGLVLEGYIVDVLGSTYTEKAMDLIYSNLQTTLKKNHLKATNRYSPGYCDWQVIEQKKLFTLLPDNFCGISLSESALMTPIKSVSGFIGIGGKVKYHSHTCNMCTSTQCIYRNLNTERDGIKAFRIL